MRKLVALFKFFNLLFFVSLSVHAQSLDTDGDGIIDFHDNCTLVANTDQRDSNGDGIGNVCDMDYNNDGIVSALDFSLFYSAFSNSSNDPQLYLDTDCNGDGSVTTIDFGCFFSQYNQAPGPFNKKKLVYFPVGECSTNSLEIQVSQEGHPLLPGSQSLIAGNDCVSILEANTSARDVRVRCVDSSNSSRFSEWVNIDSSQQSQLSRSSCSTIYE